MGRKTPNSTQKVKMNQPTQPLTHKVPTYQSTKPPIHLSTHPPTHPPTHLTEPVLPPPVVSR